MSYTLDFDVLLVDYEKTQSNKYSGMTFHVIMKVKGQVNGLKCIVFNHICLQKAIPLADV